MDTGGIRTECSWTAKFAAAAHPTIEESADGHQYFCSVRDGAGVETEGCPAVSIAVGPCASLDLYSFERGVRADLSGRARGQSTDPRLLCGPLLWSDNAYYCGLRRHCPHHFSGQADCLLFYLGWSCRHSSTG